MQWLIALLIICKPLTVSIPGLHNRAQPTFSATRNDCAYVPVNIVLYTQKNELQYVQTSKATTNINNKTLGKTVSGI